MQNRIEIIRIEFNCCINFQHLIDNCIGLNIYLEYVVWTMSHVGQCSYTFSES